MWTYSVDGFVLLGGFQGGSMRRSNKLVQLTFTAEMNTINQEYSVKFTRRERDSNDSHEENKHIHIEKIHFKNGHFLSRLYVYPYH